VSRCLILSLTWIVLSGTVFHSGQASAQSPSQPVIEARISTESSTIREGEALRVRFEIENVSNQILLVGRDPEVIANWPFRLEVQLDDSSGRKVRSYTGGYVDPVQMADLALKDGILQWWMPLTPHTFMGTYVSLPLTEIRPGAYRLSVKYVSIRPRSPSEATPEQRAIASKFSFFDGTVQTNYVSLEVVP
jgi:hypothetical protein